MILDTRWDDYRREDPVIGKRSIGPCPPHGPIMFSAVERKAYVARCLRCGLSSPARSDGVEAQRALGGASGGYQAGRRIVDQYSGYA